MKLNNNVYLIVAYCHKQGQQLCIIYYLSSPLVGKRDIVVTILVRCMCVRPSGFVWTLPCTIMYGFQNNLAQLLPLRRSAI